MGREHEEHNEPLSCTTCLGDYSSFLFSAISLAWFFYSYVLELVADFNLEHELRYLQCYSTKIDWDKVLNYLGLPLNTNLTESNLEPFFTGSGYEVNGTFIPLTAMECNMDMDVAALNFFIIIAVFNIVAFMIIASCLTCYKFSLFSGCRIDSKRERAADRVDKALGIQQITSVIFSVTKILVYLSVLNKLRYLGMWNDNDFFNIQDFGIPILFGEPAYRTLAERVKGDVAKTSFNIFRTYWFFQAIYFANGSGCDMLTSSIRCLIVMFPATVLWTIKAIADSGIFHYTQQIYTDQGVFILEPRINIAIANVCFGSATLLIIFYYNIMTVWAGEDLVRAHKKGHHRLTRLLFCFPLVFILICFMGPIILWFGDDDKGFNFEVLFIMAMVANGVLGIVILVGICNPSCYRYVVLCAIGDPKFKEVKMRSKQEMSDTSAETIQS